MKNHDNARALLLACSLASASLLASVAAAAQQNYANKLAVRLDAGETYVIDGLSRTTAPRLNVISNPNALVINTDMPGVLMLVGAEAGRWEITAERANGQPVTYDVTITSIARPFSNPLAPGRLPSMPDQMTTNSSPAGVESGSITNGQPKTIEVNH